MERLDAFMARANAAFYAQPDPLAHFTTAPEISQAFGECLGHLLPMAANALEVDLGGAEGDAKVGGILGLGNKLGDMQECLAREAADLKACASKLAGGIDQGDLKTAVCGEEGGGIATGAAAQDKKLGLDGLHGLGIQSGVDKHGKRIFEKVGHAAGESTCGSAIDHAVVETE